MAIEDLIRAMQASDRGFVTQPSFRDMVADPVDQPQPMHDPETLMAALRGSGRDVFMDAIARAFATNPPIYQRRARASGGEDFLGHLLQSAAGGFSANRMASLKDKAEFAQRQFKLTEDQQKFSRENLADERKVKAQGVRDSMLEEGRNARAELAQRGMEERQAKSLAAVASRFNAGAVTGGPDELVKSWAAKIDRGEANISQVQGGRQRPNLRSEVVAYMEAQGLTAEPKALREKKAALASAQETVDQLEEMLSGISMASGPVDRLVRGPLNVVGAATQANPDASVYNEARDGFSALVARGLGHVGVLTKEDIREVRGLLPKLTDTREKANKNFLRIREVFQRAIDRQQQAYISPSGRADSAAAPPPSRGWK